MRGPANVASLGFDLKKLEAQKKLAMDYVRVDPSEILETGEYDLEGLFVRLGDAIQRVGAKRIAIDTIESLFSGLSNSPLLRSELQRLFRWLKDRSITAVVTAERGEGTLTRSGLEEYVSDCVILLDHRVTSEVSTRRLRVVKYRGSVHGTNEYPFLIERTGFSVMPITSLGWDYEVSTGRPILEGDQVGPADPAVAQPPSALLLAAGSNALDRAERWPGINEHFRGAGPDLGAVEQGCAAPVYGPRPPGTEQQPTRVSCEPAAVSPDGGAPPADSGTPADAGAPGDTGAGVDSGDGGPGSPHASGRSSASCRARRWRTRSRPASSAAWAAWRPRASSPASTR